MNHDPNQISIAKPVSLSSLGYNELWLQEQIWDNPSWLNLGELEGVSKERVVSSGGRLDILLKDPVEDKMYEIEVMLGETDASHIIRTIEYWDLIKKKWPQRQHFAVLIAEKITQRFFNVIQILSGSVPLIAIQINAIKTDSGHYLHFTKILDVYEEPDDESSQDGESYDEAYWVKKSSETLDAAKILYEYTSPVYGQVRLNYRKWSINIVKDGNNQIFVRNRAGNNVLIEFRYGVKREQIAELFEARSIQYRDRSKHFIVAMSIERLKGERELFEAIAALNKDWWNQASAGEG